MLLQLKIPKYLKLTKVEDIWRKTLETTTTVGPCLSSHIAWGLVTLVAYLFFRRIKGCCVCVCVFVCVCLRGKCVYVCGCVIMWMTVCVGEKSACVRVYHCVYVWQCVFEIVCVRERVCVWVWVVNCVCVLRWDI